MPQYTYSGRNRAGQSMKGVISAPTDAEARGKLRIMGVMVSSLKAPKGSNTKDGKDELPPLIDFEKIPFLQTKVKTSELAVFTKQLSVMTDAGLSIIQSLAMLASTTDNPKLRRTLSEIRDQLERGLDLATAMEKHPKVFNSLFCSLVRAGQNSGQLDVMLRRLSIYIEKANKLRKQLISALSYPLVVLVIAVLMTGVMLLFVVPMFAKNYEDSGKELPGLTSMVISWSHALENHFMMIIGVMSGVYFLFNKWKATPAGAQQFDLFLLKVPLFGTVISKIAIARFASTMSTLTASGIAIIEALETCAKASGNLIIEQEILNIREEVSKGKGLAVPMEKSPWFPPLVVGMIAIGEASGGLDVMLEKIANFYEDDVDSALAGLLKMIEPIMFVLIGTIVGFILLAMYLPIFDLASTVS